MTHDLWGTNHVAGVMVREDVLVCLWEDENQKTEDWLKSASLGLMWLEQCITLASLCFLPSWQEASSWEWPCGSAMTRRQRISCTCSWGTSRPPTPSTLVSSSGGAAIAAWLCAPGWAAACPKAGRKAPGEQQGSHNKNTSCCPCTLQNIPCCASQSL